MDVGFEDWEYWISMGEIGVCGFHVDDMLYWYRRNPGGRLSQIKSDGMRKELEAKKLMRDLHQESYNGRYTEVCCGNAVRQTGKNRPQNLPAFVPIDASKSVVVYVGNRDGSFHLTGRPSGVQYYIPGRNQQVEDLAGHPGVLDDDVQWFRKMKGGRDFKVMPKPKPIAPEKKAPVVSKVSLNPNLAIDPVEEIAETPVVDPKSMKVADILKMDIPPSHAIPMLEMELKDKPRKTVVKYLQKLADGG